MLKRPRRLRTSAIVREMVAETQLSKSSFVYPHFVVKGRNIKREINSMPGIYNLSVDVLLKDIENSLQLGLNKFLLFGVGEDKSENASSAYSQNSIIVEALKTIKENFGSDAYIITDVCTCAYTTHGHCGILHEHNILNDETLDVLSKMALSHAQAGADMIAPSDMMDGRILAIRNTLDAHKLFNTGIMSYSVKFASGYYGPFREAADSAPSFGDRKTYQMDFRNGREALKEAYLDETEGADILMVKPALAYLDVIKQLRENTHLPVACYNVSGEYSMVKAAGLAGWVDEQKVVMENMYAFARAGANIIITYHAKDILSNKWLY